MMLRFVLAALAAVWSFGASAQFLVAPSSATAGHCMQFGSDRLHPTTYGAPCGTATTVPATGVASFTANTVLGHASGTGSGQLLAFSATAQTFAAQTTQSAMLTTGLGLSANGVSLVQAADYAAMRTALGLVPGSDVEAWSANLDTYSASTPSALSVTASGTYLAPDGTSQSAANWAARTWQRFPVTDYDDNNQAGDGVAGPYAWCIGNSCSTGYPDFKVNQGYTRTKIQARSLLLGDPGDGVDLAFLQLNGTSSAPTSWTTVGTPGGTLYGWPLDSAGSYVPTQPLATTTYSGRTAQLRFGITQAPTPTARGGAMMLSVTRADTVDPIDRFYLKDIGAIFPGRACQEESGNAEPFNYQTVGNASGHEGFRNINCSSATANWQNATAYGNATFYTSDMSSVVTGHEKNPAIAIRRQASDTNGFDIGLLSNALTIYSTVSGTQNPYLQLGTTGAFSVGGVTGTTRNYLNLSGAASTNDPEITAASSNDTNVSLRLTAQGTGQVILRANSAIAFRAQAAVSAVNYLRAVSAATGSSPALEVVVGDTNADLTLRPAGTGSVTISPSGVGGKLLFPTTITAAGTTGDQTINKPAFTVNIAAGGSSVTVTDSLVTTSSIVLCAIRTDDATAILKNAVPASGSVVIKTTAAVTAETSIGCVVH